MEQILMIDAPPGRDWSPGHETPHGAAAAPGEPGGPGQPSELDGLGGTPSAHTLLGEVAASVRHIERRIDELSAAATRQHAEALALLREHRAYHASAEHTWGTRRLAERHPWRLALVAGLVLALLFSGPDARTSLLEALRHLLSTPSWLPG